MTRAGLIAVLLLFALAVTLLFRGGGEEEPRGEAPADRAAPARADPPPVPAAARPASEDEATGGAAPATVAPPSSTVLPDGVPAASSNLPAVRGTVVVEEPDGRLITGLSGKMTIVVDERLAREGGRIRTEQVDVKEGSWSAVFLPGTIIKVQDAVLGEREVLVDAPAVRPRK
ncbi:MAG: hypothetical protein HY812_09485 [Planctomycetes bacterium]|nr:hypothetical protein [Planctomycetota bacterium]